MNTRDCIVACFGILAAALLIAAAIISSNVTDLTEAISQPGIQDRVELAGITITTEDGTTIKLDDVDITVNSRMIDIWLGAVVADVAR